MSFHWCPVTGPKWVQTEIQKMLYELWKTLFAVRVTEHLSNLIVVPGKQIPYLNSMVASDASTFLGF